MRVVSKVVVVSDLSLRHRSENRRKEVRRFEDGDLAVKAETIETEKLGGKATYSGEASMVLLFQAESPSQLGLDALLRNKPECSPPSPKGPPDRPRRKR